MVIQDLLTDYLWKSDWAIDPTLVCEIAGHLERERPQVIVEIGSGSSSLVFARYAKETGAKFYSLESSEHYAQQTGELLRRHGLEEHASILVGELKATKHGPFYDVVERLPQNIDFALIDGPPMKHGRQAVMPHLITRMASNFTVLLDDANREHEQSCLREWKKQFELDYEILPVTCKGLAVIRRRITEPQPIEASDVVVTLLTGSRPKLLRKTLEALAGRGFLESATVVAMHNGADGDDETREILRKYNGLIDYLITSPKLIRWEGRATSQLMEVALSRGNPYVMHLEDDWQYATLDHHWLSKARKLLADKSIGQVRLRARGEKTLARHQITKAPVEYTDHGWFTRSNGHFTFNPTLMRVADARRVYPCDTEANAQHHFQHLGLDIAQLNPGAFHHIGEVESLREQTRGQGA